MDYFNVGYLSLLVFEGVLKVFILVGSFLIYTETVTFIVEATVAA